MTRWQRDSGPLVVWKVVDGYEVSKDGKKQPVKFSIQELPDTPERRQEVIDLLINHFLPDEAMCKCLKISQNPDAVNDFKIMWDYSLDQRAAVACYKLNSDGSIGELAGVNCCFVLTHEVKNDFDKLEPTFKSENFRRIWDYFSYLVHEASTHEYCKVDTSIGSISLCVNPKYRGQKLGVYILEARRDIGKKYGIPATSTMFTVPTSQLQAKRAGFEEILSVDYKDAYDKKGNLVFPNIESTCVKIMGMKLL